MPPKPIRELRELTRYRKTLIQERVQEINRLQKVLEGTNLKLAAVASDVLGKSGCDMLEAIIGGEQDAEVLAELARGRLRGKLPVLRQALAGRGHSRGGRRDHFRNRGGDGALSLSQTPRLLGWGLSRK